MQNLSKEHRPSKALWAALAVFALSLAGPLGCSSEADPLPTMGGSGDKGSAGVLVGPCKDGTQHHCSETLDQANGELTCWEGTQYCQDGRWSACLEGELTHRPDPTAKANRPYINPLAISAAPVACINNPCDPTCMWWDEDPNPDLTPPTVVSGNPTYGGLPTASVCTHDICSTGAALDLTCSACVTTVCSNASYSSCCDSSVLNAWNQTCVDAAYTLCLNQPPPLGLCDFGLYSTGNVIGADRVTSGVAIGSNTYVQLGVDSNPSRVAVNGNLDIANGNGNPIIAPNGIIATGNITVAAGNSKITGTVQAGGSVTLNSGVTVTGNVYARTNITGQFTGTINGTGYAGGTVDPILTVSTRVNGSTHAAPVVTIPTTIPTKTVTCSTNAADDRWVSGSASVLTLPPGNYRNVSVSNDATLVLSAEGSYTFSSLQINTGKLRLGAAFTTVGYDVDVCNNFTLRGQSSYNEIQDSTGALLTTPVALRIYVDGTTVDMGSSDMQFVGILRAPNASVSKGNYGTIRGAIWSKSMSLGTDQNATGITEAECDALNLGGEEPVVTCPAQNTTPAVPPGLNEPCNTGADCQLNNRCVEPQTVGGSHSKCLEGTALSATQGDACVAKICAADPTCCSTAWTPSCVAKVATVCDAVCGTSPSACLHQACTTGSALSTTCDPCIANICTTYPSCCNSATGSWDSTCANLAYTQCGTGVTPATELSPTSICDFAGYGLGSVTAQGTAGAGLSASVSGGKFGGRGAVAIQYATVDGDAFAVGAFTLQNSTVTGTSYQESAGAPSVSSFTGTSPLYPVTVPRPNMPAPTFSCPGGGTIPAGGNGSLAPGNYGALTVNAGSTLTLSAGTYTFSSITMAAQSGANVATLALPASGDVRITVCGAVTFNRGAKMTGLTAATALNLELWASGQVQLKSGTTLYGFVYSSSGATPSILIDRETTTPAGTTLKGMAITTGTIQVLTSSAIDYTGLRSACLAKSLTAGLSTSYSTPDRLCAYSAYGTTDLVTTSSSSTNMPTFKGGDVGSAGAVTFASTGSARTQVYGNVFSRGNVTLSDAEVVGDVRTTGTISSGTAGGVTGTKTPTGTDRVPNPTGIPTVSFTCPTGGSAVTASGTTNISPNKFGVLTVPNWNTINFQTAGSYYFDSIDIQANGRIQIPATGTVKIYSCGQIKLGAMQTPSGLSTTAGSDWNRLQFYSLSNNSTDAVPAIYVSSSSSNPAYGVLMAPNGMIALQGSAMLKGTAWGNQVKLLGNAQIDRIGNDTVATVEASCQTLAIDQLPSCPVSWAAPTPPNESATCTANATGATGYKDSTCSGYDLALGLACDAQVAVCNHGTTGFTGALDVYYFGYGDRQMSTPTPVLGAKDGTCSTPSISIAAGYCTNLPCTFPTASAAAPLTLMVGPTTGASALSECSSTYPRNLDNWSVFDGRSCSTSSDLTQVEGYAATCSVPGTHPRWGQFTWNADVPGASTIEFWARTGADATAAASATYSLVSTATTTNQVCALSGPTGCPIDLTAALSLNKNNQDPYMDLKMILKSSGSSAPTLKDWKIRYSCVFDE